MAQHNYIDHTQLDPDRIRTLYETHSFRETAKLLGVGELVLRRACVHHGIPRRRPGATIPRRAPFGRIIKLSRIEIERLVMRLYLERSDRCPPGCPGREACLTELDECLLPAIVDQSWEPA